VFLALLILIALGMTIVVLQEHVLLHVLLLVYVQQITATMATAFTVQMVKIQVAQLIYVFPVSVLTATRVLIALILTIVNKVFAQHVLLILNVNLIFAIWEHVKYVLQIMIVQTIYVLIVNVLNAQVKLLVKMVTNAL
jgi:hypothetical protein